MITFLYQSKKMYDIETIQDILKVSRSKIHRELKKNNVEFIKYKNLFLYYESALFNLMEIILIDKINKQNELSND